MTKLMVIGIDSMDSHLISKYLDSLPTFRRMIEKNEQIDLMSVFPPDSESAWASIYTGLNPARHGVVHFVDPLEKMTLDVTDPAARAHLKDNAFWDFAGRSGKTVCIVFPHKAYPVWSVNGFMISKSPKEVEFSIYPPDYGFRFPLKKIEIPHRIPNGESEYAEYLRLLEKMLRNEFDFAKYMMKEREWDLFFVYTDVLDFVQHVFWNFCDPDDPTFPGENNPYRDVIRQFYVLCDTLLGELVATADADTAVMVLSDHGHSMRPLKLFNINELLRQHGYLVEKEGVATPLRAINERLKRVAANAVQRLPVRTTALNLLRKHPIIKEMYAIPSTIDFDRSIARSSDLSGLKSYTYGGIWISKDKIASEAEYYKIRQEIIDLLSTQTEPQTQEKLFQWITGREELYTGSYIDVYPDLLFQLRDDYGAGWRTRISLFSEVFVHNLFPGSHNRAGTVLFLSNIGERKSARKSASLMDIAPTILDLLGIHDAYDFDGTSILEAKDNN
jgi:predicted AlkP superfamily phosphohydrolase/phosphomutase